MTFSNKLILNFLSRRLLCKLSLSIGICVLCESALIAQGSLPSSSLQALTENNQEHLAYVWQIDEQEDKTQTEESSIPLSIDSFSTPSHDVWLPIDSHEVAEQNSELPTSLVEEVVSPKEEIALDERAVEKESILNSAKDVEDPTLESFVENETIQDSPKESSKAENSSYNETDSFEESPLEEEFLFDTSSEDSFEEEFSLFLDNEPDSLEVVPDEEKFLFDTLNENSTEEELSFIETPINPAPSNVLEGISVKTEVLVLEEPSKQIGSFSIENVSVPTKPLSPSGIADKGHSLKNVPFPHRKSKILAAPSIQTSKPLGIAFLDEKSVQLSKPLSHSTQRIKKAWPTPKLQHSVLLPQDPLLSSLKNKPWPKRLIPLQKPIITKEKELSQHPLQDVRLTSLKQKEIPSQSIGHVAESSIPLVVKSAGTVNPILLSKEAGSSKVGSEASSNEPISPLSDVKVISASQIELPSSLGKSSLEQPFEDKASVLPGIPSNFASDTQKMGREVKQEASASDAMMLASLATHLDVPLLSQSDLPVYPDQMENASQANDSIHNVPKENEIPFKSLSNESGEHAQENEAPFITKPLPKAESQFSFPEHSSTESLQKETPITPEPVSVPATAVEAPVPMSINPTPQVPTETIIPVSPVSSESRASISQQPAVEQTQSNQDSKHEDTFLINFTNVAIIEYLNFISKVTNKNFIFDDADLDFKVSIVSTEPTSVENIMAALLQELRIHGLSLMEIGNNLIIHRNYRVNSPATVVLDGETEIPKSDLVTQVFRISNSSPEKIAEIIRPMLSELAIVEADPDTAHLIITDLTTNVIKISALIHSLDAPSTDLEIGQYVVNNASVDAAVLLAEKILAPLAKGKTLIFVPHQVTNSIYIVSTPFLVERAIAVLQHIDVSEGETRILSVEKLSLNKEGVSSLPGGASLTSGQNVGKNKGGSKWGSALPLGHVESTKFFIKKLQYQHGDKLVDSLKKIADSLLASATQNTDLITTINSIQWLESSNSLVYTGTADSINKVTELVNEIDIPLRQVLIEMLIIETTVDDSLNFGVDWGARFAGDDAAGSEAFLSSSSPLSFALDSAVPNNPLNATGLARNAGFSLGVIGRNVTHCGIAFNSLGALVTALHTDAVANIVLNPKVVVEDNTPAEVFVGLNTAFQTQAIANDQGNIITSNFEFRDVGSTLKVTPLIGNNDIITLDISQEVSTIVPLTTLSTGTTSGLGITTASAGQTANNPGPTTRKSKTTTRIHVPNEYFVILSGMIQDEDAHTRSQVPCLGGIPILGGAFSQRGHIDNKRNLMIFIRPQIVRNDEIDAITKREQDIFKEKSRIRKRWEYEVEEALDFFNLKEPCDPEQKLYYRN